MIREKVVSDLRVGALYYSAGVDYIYVIYVDDNGQSEAFRLLEWNKAFPLIDSFLECVTGSYPPGRLEAVFKAFAYDWGKQLLPPSKVLEGNDILVIIPHYTLFGLPFHAIYIERAGQFLGLSHGITYCSSATLFRHCIARNVKRAADPTCWKYTTDSEGTVQKQLIPGCCLGLGIDVLGDETSLYHELAEHFTGFFETRKTAALLPRFLLKQPKYDAICLVCHGYYDRADPDNCGLLLAGQPGLMIERPIMLGGGESCNFRDLPFRPVPSEISVRPDCSPEFMTINELKVAVDCRAELVALLGCWTGTGSPASVEDPGTLAEQWLRSGAASALANLWQGYLPFLRQWIDLFMVNWATRKQPKAIAWREAMRNVLNEHLDTPLQHWASITLMGDWL